MAEGLAKPQWLDLEKKPTNHIMAKTICFMTCANHGIGAEIARAALAVGTSLPSQTSVASWPSLKGESRCYALRPHWASGLGNCTLNARRRTALSALGRFYAQRAFGRPMAKIRQISDQSGDSLDARRSEARPSLTTTKSEGNPQ